VNANSIWMVLTNGLHEILDAKLGELLLTIAELIVYSILRDL
jgi:hypothetical protein